MTFCYYKRAICCVASLTLAVLGLCVQLVTSQSLFAQEQQETSIEIEADHGIDWVRKENLYVARGNVVLRRDAMEIYAERVEVRYKDKTDLTSSAVVKDTASGQEITRIDAFERVKVVNQQMTAYGSQGLYYADQDVAQLTGQGIRMLLPNANITAEKSLEYWRTNNQAVARGSALIIYEQNRLSSDILVAIFDPQESSEHTIKRIDAIGNVHISTIEEIIQGDKGVYHPITDSARVCGNVSIIKGTNIATGECADVNMKTGRATLQGKLGQGRVKALIKP